MRVLFATTANAGHFRPLVPFAEACLRAGHEVLVAGQAGAAPAAQRAGLSFQALAEPDDEELAMFRSGQADLSATQAMGRALTELYIRLYAGAALEDMLTVIEEWHPDVVVRESAEFSALVAAQHLGVRHARVGIGLSTQLESQMLSLAAPALDQLGAAVGVAPGLAVLPDRCASRWRPLRWTVPIRLRPSGSGVFVKLPPALPVHRRRGGATRLRRWSTCRSALRCPPPSATTSPASTAPPWRPCRGPARACWSRSAISATPPN